MTIKGSLISRSAVLSRLILRPPAAAAKAALLVCFSLGASYPMTREVQAQGAFPAPLPGQAAAQQASPFPAVNGASAPAPAPGGFSSPPGGFSGGDDAAFSRGAAPLGGVPQQSVQGAPPPGGQKCQADFTQLRVDAEKKAAVISALGKRKGSATEACKAIGAFSQAETKMISYVTANATKCGIPEQISQQMKKAHVSTEQLLTKVCAAAQQQQQGPAGPSLSEVLGSTSVPEAKATTRTGGSTFDTLNGNVLTR